MLCDLVHSSCGFSLPADRKTIFFNSHQVSKPESSSDLTAVSRTGGITRAHKLPYPFVARWLSLRSTVNMSFLLLFSKLDEQMPCLPPPSSEAVAALVRELRVLLGMTLFGVDIIINIHTHTLTVIDINIFPGTEAVHTHTHTHIKVDDLTLFSPSGYEGVPQFFPSLLSHIESVLDKQASAGPQPTAQTTGGPSAASTGLSDASGTAQGLPSSAS